MLPFIVTKCCSVLAEALFLIAITLLILRVKITLTRAIIFCLIKVPLDIWLIMVLPHSEFQFTFILVVLADVILAIIVLGLQWAKSLAAIAIGAIAINIGSISAMVFFFMLGIPKEVTQSNVIYYMAGVIITFITSFIIALIIYFMRLTAIMPDEIKRKRNAFSAVYILITFLMMGMNMSFVFYGPPGTANAWYAAFNLVIIIIYFILGLYNTYRNNELEMKKQELEYQKLYSSTLNEILEGHRRIKHNFNNILHTINGYVLSGKWKELKEYFSEVLEEDAASSKRSHINLSKVKNPALFGLLNAKVSTAAVKSLDFQITVNSEIDKVSVRIYELCEILGILLDNAIEAAEKSAPKSVRVRIEKDEKDAVSFSIENSFEGDVDIERIFEKGYTTSGDSSRGIGLWMVRNTVNKYKNMMLNTWIKGNTLCHNLTVEQPYEKTNRQTYRLPVDRKLQDVG